MRKPKRSIKRVPIGEGGRMVHLAGDPKHTVWKPASAKTCADLLYQDDDGKIKGSGLSEYQRKKFIEIAGDEYEPNYMERRKKETKQQYLDRLLSKFGADSKKTA